MGLSKAAALLALALIGLCAATAGLTAQERRSIRPKSPDSPLSELISGYDFSPIETRALQDDDFDNPGFAWVQKGEAAWGQAEGAARKACSSCHGSASDSMRGKAASYPKFDKETGRIVNLEQRINLCREKKMQASPWLYESDPLLSMTAFLRMQSRGVPVNVATDGPVRATFEAGRTLYNTRLGQLGMSCALCHNNLYGRSLRDQTISQGHSNGVPSFERESRSFISLHGRFNRCFALMRAEPFELGSKDYLALELYLGWRGNGLPIETPAVRR
jgi:sulfur-oxidizing protein SoxA